MAVFKVKNEKHGTKVRSKVNGAKPKYKLWGFKEWYTDIYGNRKQYLSKKYETKDEAEKARAEWINSHKNKVETDKNMTFKELIEAHREFNKDKVKDTTLSNYRTREVGLKILDNIKVNDFNIAHYEMWRNSVNEKSIATITKNDFYKYLKAILNYGMKYHDLDIRSTYNKMVGFSNPNEIKKEMDFYTNEEFKILISFETDLKYVALFKTLYYCGLRNGELRGITWSDIDFENKKLRINKQVPTMYPRRNFDKNKHLTSPKTKSSVRTLPIPNPLFDSLVEYYEVLSKAKNFDKNWFVFGDALPKVAEYPSSRLRELCDKSGLRLIRIHDFRHSCASDLINKNANITMVAKYLGHAKIEETLNTYAHMYEDELVKLVDLMD